MKRDMELIRKILFAIEEQYVDVAIYNLQIEGYSIKQIAYHCSIIHQAGFVSAYKGLYAGNELYNFGVGALTWEGHDYLEKIRDDTIWNKTKLTIVEKGLPFVIETVREIASAIIAGMVQGVIKSI